MSTPYHQKEEREIAAFLEQHVGLEQFRPGLERISPLFRPLIDQFKSRGVQVITIAGTNGKGETSMVLSHLLTVNGARPATWTSPHILSIRERFSYAGELISYQRLADLLHTHYFDLHQRGIQLSYYELLFYLFCQFALECPVTHLVLEVGLGGRFDAVNLFDADYAAITSISRDHQAILGNSYRQILTEKIGVARAQRPLVTLFQLGFLRQQTNLMADIIGAKHLDLAPFWGDVADYSRRNQLVAASLCSLVLDGLDFSSHRALQLLEKASIPTLRGRKERVTRGKRSFIFIGAHNVEGMRVLYTSGMHFAHGIVAFSNRPQADVVAAAKIAHLVCDQVVFTCFEHAKALKPEQLAPLGLTHYAGDWKAYLDDLCSQEGETVIMGSYYFIGEVQKYFET